MAWPSKKIRNKRSESLILAIVTPPQETIAHCDVNATKGNGCYKCGSNDHYIKDCPLNRDIGNTYNSSSNSQQKQYSAHSKDQRKAGHESSLEQSLQTMTDQLKSLA